MDWEQVQKEITLINKQYGKGSVLLLGEEPKGKVEVIATGSPGLDFKLGIGGFPKKHVVELFGSESSGKSSLCAHLCANVQKEGGLAAYIDAEHEVDLDYFEAIGVNTSELVFSQPDDLEQGLAILQRLLETNLFSVIVFDSVAQAATKNEIEGEITDNSMGVKARKMGQHLRQITPLLSKTNTCIVYVNQVRDNISMYGGGPVTPGGNALKFKAAIRIQLRKVSDVLKGTDKMGIRVRAKVIKNKRSAPMREWEFTILFGQGIISELDLIELGTQIGIIKKAGAWYSFNDENIGQGTINAAETLKANVDLRQQITKLIMESLGIQSDTEEISEDIITITE